MSRLIIPLLFLLLFPMTVQKAFCGKKVPILTPDKVKKGMKGYGLTVFGGKKIERFNVVVLGVMKNRGPQRDLILVRASGGILAKSGVIAGMSGSPIYLEDKLVGALAYAWGFSKEAIAGVQPIEAMYELRDRKPMKRAKRIIRQGLKPVEVSKGEGLPRSVIEPLPTPVFMDGFCRDSAKLLDNFFSQNGLMPIGGKTTTTAAGKGAALKIGGGKTHSLKPMSKDWKDITPGQAVSACLLRGDLNLSAVGTLTHRDGKKILAFGHPFFCLGDINIPLCRADVQTVLPSLALSFKMANTLEPIGAVIRDGETAIVGMLGQEAPMADITMTIKKEGKKEPSHYRFQAAIHELLTPIMVRSAITSVLNAETKVIGKATLKVKTTVKLKGYDPITMKNTFATTLFPSMAISGGLSPLFALLNNSFEKVQLERVDVEVEAEEQVRSAKIEAVRWLKDTYEPGEELRGAVIMRPHERSLTFETFKIRLPEDLPDGRLNITVASGRDHLYIRQKRDPGYFRPKSVEQLGKVYEELPDFTDFVVSFSYGREGASFAGTQMPQLPPSMSTLIDGCRGKRFEKLIDDKTYDFGTKWVTEGKSQFTIQIKGNPNARRAQ